MQVFRRCLAVLVPLVLCLVQQSGALPNPDFGVSATINPAKVEVLLQADLLSNDFRDVTNVTVTLVSGVTMLNRVQAAVGSIRQQFRNTGISLAQQLVSLATRNTTPANQSSFTLVYQAISMLANLTSNGLTSELASISSVMSSTVAKKFNDAFSDLRYALNQLRLALEALERAVRKARMEAGNAPTISEMIVRQNIPAKVQSDVTETLIELRAKVRAVRYLVWTSLRLLQTADDFLGDIVGEVSSFGRALGNSLLAFGARLNRLKQDTVRYVTSAFGCGVQEQRLALTPFSARLQAISNYNTTLKVPLEGILSMVGSDAISALAQAFAENLDLYSSDAASASANAGLFIRTATCPLLRTMVLTLISFGPQHEYCFNSYAARVFSLYSVHYNYVSECYETELQRLTTMGHFLRHLVQVLLYDVEELADNLAVCADLPPTRDASCLTQQGNLYKSVQTVLSTMFNDGGSLIDEELAASLARLNGCVASSEQTTLHTITRLDQRVKSCQSVQTK